ncbi:MAG TPA: ABC transporter substrate-binding protein [Mycobacteriales bacterium]|nr:ABC transporter substrate-binding protein [Mycobacteriales bacterium]
MRKVGFGAVGLALVLGAVACGSSSSGGTTSPGGGGSTGSKPTVVLGTTDTIVSADPAGAYDLPSWTLMYNVYQTLLQVPAGTSNIAPEAAKCAWHGTTTYVCSLVGSQTFSNGDPLTAQDVVYSFNRVLKINSPDGPASLFGPMKKVTASGNTVTFTLKAPDAAWPYVLTTAAGAIVDSKVFPANKLLADGKVIGSGPYQLSSYTPNQVAEFTPNPHYGGTDQLNNSKFIVKYEQDASTLVSDAQSGTVDIAYRTLSPTQLQALQGSSGISLVQGKGIEIRYLVFNEKLGPGTTDAKGLAIRQAAAQVIDRSTIASQVYRGTVQPAYSIVPQGLNGATEALKTAYGAGPNVAKAKATLAAAGVTTPVSFTLWYNVNHYNDADLATELMRELNASGLFKVKLQTAEWATYEKSALSNGYGVFLFGWFPDYPDADDYTAPFFGCDKASFLDDSYCNSQVTHLISAEQAQTNNTKRLADFATMQTVLAQTVPVVPIWQGGQVAAVHSGITGVQQTLDPSYTFRFWMVGKS